MVTEISRGSQLNNQLAQKIGFFSLSNRCKFNNFSAGPENLLSPLFPSLHSSDRHCANLGNLRVGVAQAVLQLLKVFRLSCGIPFSCKAKRNARALFCAFSVVLSSKIASKN